MRDLSFFLLKNNLGAKMKKGIRSFCNGNDSTSTLNQRNKSDRGNSSCMVNPSLVSSPYFINTSNMAESPPPTLEEMILQLELEEEIARKAKFNDYGHEMQRRMSCGNNSDILQSARNALNQYPRFSLDGKDAMYRSSFRNSDPISAAGRKSICCSRALRDRFQKNDFDSRSEKKAVHLPTTLAGEKVIWCKPGVVAKLMGLEAMPVPTRSKEKLSSIRKQQNFRRIAERHEMERRRLVMDVNGRKTRRQMTMGSCSRTGYCIMKPVLQ